MSNVRAAPTKDTDYDSVVEQALASGPPTMLYQPVVDLRSSAHPIVGFEALARWPTLPHVTPEQLFVAANEGARLSELDWRCRLAAVRGAFAAGLGGRTALFVNVEPAATLLRPPRGGHVAWRRAAEELDVVLEVTERHVLDRPTALLASVGNARRNGWRVALDDVGANPDSLAMIEFLRPDIVKLDLSLVRSAVAGDRARTMMAVSAYCEHTGALTLAEGIENEDQLERARALGASLGQGYLFGAPGPLDPTVAHGSLPGRPLREPSTPTTPFQFAARKARIRVARRSVFAEISRDLEQRAAAAINPPVVLAAFGSVDLLSAHPLERYARLAQRCPLVVVVATDMPDDPAPRVHGATLAPDDPLVDEWTVVMVGPHYAAALVAQRLDHGNDGPADDPRYRGVLTHDRDTVVAIGRALLNRLVLSDVAKF